MFDYQNHTTLITGASSGIGVALQQRGDRRNPLRFIASGRGRAPLARGTEVGGEVDSFSYKIALPFSGDAQRSVALKARGVSQGVKKVKCKSQNAKLKDETWSDGTNSERHGDEDDN